uniref:Uncharacterized protein n=1 Tax=Moniliophthora roreri TaxID=221103 RepID=A0A0W0FEP0_MONRR
MSERWDQQFHVNADGQNLEDFQLLFSSPIPYPDHQFYYHGPPYSYPIDSAGPTASLPFERGGESHPSPIGNMDDDFSGTGLSNGQLTAVQGSGYGHNMSSGPYATSYGSSSGFRSHECMNMATGPSFPGLQSDPKRPALQSLESTAAPYAPQSHDPSHITGSALSDLERWYNAIYPLSTSDSTECVPDPLNAQPRVIKQVVATECVMHWFPAVSGYVHQGPQFEK